MIVTPFGDLRLNDPVAEAGWIDAHLRRHQQETIIAKIGGGQTLDGPIDGDWFHRHWARHVALATFQGIDLSSFTQGLVLRRRWRTKEELLDWMELHNRIHLKQDRQLGL